ncbi:MAG: sigma-70 family RNA polymerase sigma factor [Phycisphaerales bacterium]|nr:MAG: sigma-70 family RNA polymerase sigma factor [Phycisphaerales bacterium]
MLNDKRLIWRLRRADVDALRQLYDKYKGDLLRLAVILTGDVCQAEDVVQDVFLKLVDSYHRISIRGNVRNYLIACLVNRMRSLQRGAGHRHEIALETPVTQMCPGPRPDQWAVLNEQMQQLSAAMRQLPPEQREVIALRFEAGLGFRRIAHMQQVSINTAQGRCRYGMEKLRSVLHSEVTHEARR